MLDKLLMHGGPNDLANFLICLFLYFALSVEENLYFSREQAGGGKKGWNKMEQEETGWQENELFALAKMEFLFVDVIIHLMVIWKKSSGIYDFKKRSTSVWCSAI